MKKIKLSDFKLKEVEEVKKVKKKKFKPLFLGMKEKDIDEIKYNEDHII